MNINAVNWKGWNCNAHIDEITKNIIIDIWVSPGIQPTTAEIQQASDDYDIHLAAQDAKYPQWLSKIASIEYDDIPGFIDPLSSVAQMKVALKKMCYFMVSLKNIIKEDRKVE